MTNREKLIKIIHSIFDVNVDIDRASLGIANCAYLECQARPYAASCSTCKYNGFWKQEYDDSEEEDMLIVLETMKHILGLSETEKKALDYAIKYIKGEE